MTISLAELRQQFGAPDLTVVDVRALPAYNGWRARGAARGGHIPGAVAFPIAWLDSVDKPEVERLLQSKGILQRGEVVLYGDGPQDPVALKTRLAELGQTAVRIYGGGWAEWAADPTLPVDRLTNYEKLVHAAGPVQAVPCQLRRSGRVRGESHPRGVLSRHQPARESDGLEPPIARGARGGRARIRDNP